MGEKITREAVILAFLKVSFEKSAGEASLADIASTLGIKKPSLYNHFDSRDAIISATLEYCKNYLAGLSFIPSEIDAVVQKYQAETVLKGIASRHIKMHEKNPLFQIYVFLNSMQFFISGAQEILEENSRKLVQQTEVVLNSLRKENKISIDEVKVHRIAQWFCYGLTDLLKQHLLIIKDNIRNNPQSGEEDLFPLPNEDHNIEKINAMVESFTALL